MTDLWEIQTYVMFDTETTGLPSPGNIPRITEICFIALGKEELLSRHTEPRVVNKLSLCLNPCKAVHHIASEISGLHNDALSTMPTFAQQADVIISFLQNLPQPACLLAHNGHGFDFPILTWELEQISKKLPETIVCADTLHAFRFFDGIPERTDHQLMREKEWKNKNATKKLELTAPIGACSNVTSMPPGKNETSDPVDLHGDEKMGFECLEKEEKMDTDIKPADFVWQQGSNETTPDRKIFQNQVPMNIKKGEEYIPDVTAVRRHLFVSSKSNDEKEEEKKESKTNVINPCKDSGMNFSSQRSITDSDLDLLEACQRQENSFSDAEDGECKITKGEETMVKFETSKNEERKEVKSRHSGMATAKNAEKVKRTQLRPYSLPNLHMQVFGEPPEAAHTAEGDCKTLLKLVHLKFDSIMSYCAKTAVLFSDIEAMC